MFSKKKTTESTGACSDNIEKIRTALKAADCILIGAGAGLSASAGFTYDAERFERYFSDFLKKYHFRNMYEAGFYPFDSPEEYWAYWSRYIYINRYMDPPRPVYGQLLELIKDRDYFVLTTNVDHCFQKSGFEKERLFYMQGDYGLWQCGRPCHRAAYDNEKSVRRMVAEQKDMRIPSGLLPKCPVCGAPMTMNLRMDDTFVQDEGWDRHARYYENFLTEHKGKKMVLLELGTGYNTPGIIKYPFWQMTSQNPNAVYICINRGDAAAPAEIGERSICVDADIGDVLAKLQGEKGADGNRPV